VATLCTDYKLLFIHGQGTASTAIREALQRELGGVDVPPREIKDREGRVVVGRHATLRMLVNRGLIPADHDLLVATAIRNPFDYLVSSWLKLRAAEEGRIERPDATRVPERLASRRSAAELPFHQWVAWRYARDGLLGRLRGPRPDRFPQAIGATVVMRFETIADDFAGLLRRVGFERPVQLDRVNATQGRDRAWRRYYTVEARQIVERAWADDLERFGYRF
jgi:hypothetical protein